MGAGMCKDIVPGAGVGGVGRGGTCPASGGCRDSVDRAMERILHRKTQSLTSVLSAMFGMRPAGHRAQLQEHENGMGSDNEAYIAVTVELVIDTECFRQHANSSCIAAVNLGEVENVVHGSNISARPNGISIKSSSSPTPFMFSELPKRPHPGLKGPRTPPVENGDGHLDPPVPEQPPVRPPRKKDRLRKPALPLPRRNQSAATLASPAATAADLEVYLKRCHSMGAVPALLEELKNSRQGSSVSSLTSSSLESRHQIVQSAQDRLPSFASVTPPPSPSSPGDENSFNNTPHFFIGSRNRSPTSSQDAASYVDLWTSGKAKGPLIGRDEDGMDDLICKLRRVRSQGESDRYGHSDRRGDHGVGPLTEHVIDILPTKCAGPPNLSVIKSSSTPHLAQAPSGNAEEDRNNPRTILLKILGQYHRLPGSGGFAGKGKKGEEDDLRAIEKQLDATWGHIKRNSSRAEDSGGKKRSRTRDEEEDEDDNSSSSVTPSLGELEEALAEMLEEDDWEEREEERAMRAEKERKMEEAEERAMREVEERARTQERREERLKEEGESGGSVMALRMKRENTFTALSDLSKDEVLE
ncbi:hypothetical protein J437_LFUL012434 [Ladona fulva]|uniref:Uncharacterized protein n=1 Tax=Ladona fulva TaxID=123851 RepID=A0A8K0KDH7_LADFU|nr:hypothetical protein J437_LFUL012434 [Ladona fulva]